MNCDECRSSIHPYMDGELGLLKALAIERHLAACAACKLMHAQHAAARMMLHGHATRYTAPAALRVRIRKSTAPAVERRRPAWLPHQAAKWPSFGAALAFTAMLTWGVTTHFHAVATGVRLPEEIVASHVRALVTGQLAELESREVRPWLMAKLGFAPRANDHAQNGFALVGSRIDYVRKRRVAVMVYRRRGHPIDVFAWPDTGRDPVTHEVSRRGYNLINWKSNGLFFCAVSDLDRAELAALARLLERDAG